MPEPVVIELEDGHQQDVIVRCADTKVSLRMCAHLTRLEPAFVSVDYPIERCAIITLEPDPVRAAELKERERIRAGIRTACEHHDADPALIEGLVDVLDAPDESSEYRRGEGEMLEKCVTVLEGQRHYCAHVESLVEELRKHLSEPTHD